MNTVRQLRLSARARLREALAPLEPEVAALECDILLAEVLKCSRAQLVARLDQVLNAEQLEAFESLLQRRSCAEPVAYLLGEREFYGRSFYCSTATLIPRPDSETMIEAVLRSYRADSMPAMFMDLGCGTGCLGITLALEFAARGWRGALLLSDIVPEALYLAKRNAQRHGLEERCYGFCGDAFTAVGWLPSLVVSNPPYIAEGAQLMPDVANYEPATALRSGPDGLSLITRLMRTWSKECPPGGHFFIEIGASQHLEVESLARESGCRELRFFQDLSGAYRVVELRS